MKIIKTKQIAFNVADPFQKDLYDHACKAANFSRYGKKLIHMDMTGDYDVVNRLSDQDIALDESILEGFI